MKKIKKIITRISVIFLGVLFVSLFNIQEANAASYPFISMKNGDEDFYVDSDYEFKFYYIPEYNNEKVYLYLYNPDGKLIATSKRQFDNRYSTPIINYTITGNSTGYETGTYKIKIKYEFYSYYGWHTAPRDTIYYVDFKDNPNVGWKQNNVGWWYANGDGSYPVSCWKKIDEIWYYFDSDGYMVTGWVYDNGNWYYMENSGAMKTGWLCEGGVWYYLKDDGAMVTGWEKINRKWYYFYGSGEMAVGWINDNGTWYYLYDDGSMAKSTYIGEYRVNSSGAWVR